MRTHWTDYLLPPKPPRSPNPYRRFDKSKSSTHAEDEHIKHIVRQEIETLDERVRQLEMELHVEVPTK